MIHLIRTDANHPDFKSLARQLDVYLTEKDGDDHSFYDQFNQIESIRYVVIIYADKVAVGCSAMKQQSKNLMEIKRMYVTPEMRSNGIATQILKALEDWAKELLINRFILETGKRQPEAIQLYQKNGYQIIPNYEPYTHIDNSICFEKHI